LIIDFIPFLITGYSFGFTRAAGNPIGLLDSGGTAIGSGTPLSMYTFELNGCDKVDIVEASDVAAYETLVNGSDVFTVSRAHYAGGRHGYGALIWATGTPGLSAPTEAVGGTSANVFTVSNFKEFPVAMGNDHAFLRAVSGVTPATVSDAGIYCLSPETQVIQSAQTTSRIATLAFYEAGGTAPSDRYSLGVRATYGTLI
jgi:hypothetical protein